jgi:hypothetical protein
MPFDGSTTGYNLVIANRNQNYPLLDGKLLSQVKNYRPVKVADIPNNRGYCFRFRETVYDIRNAQPASIEGWDGAFRLTATREVMFRHTDKGVQLATVYYFTTQ